jgi:spore germination cell wall hydrolase CwlJ-like protein
MITIKLTVLLSALVCTTANAMWTETAKEFALSKDITAKLDAMFKKPVQKPVKAKLHSITDDDIQPGYTPIKGQTNKDVKCLAYSIFREAGNQKPQDQYAVGQVHINRLKAGNWGSSMCKVVFAKAQFSWTLEKKVVNWSAKQQDYYMTIATGMMREGMRVEPLASTKILHYHATYVQPKWGDKTALVATAGAHVFYKGIK